MQLSTFLNTQSLFYVHFGLSVFAMSSNMFSNGYLVSQTVIIALYIWSFVANEDIQPLNMLTYITGATVLLDSIMIGVCWDSAQIGSSKFAFSGAMAIILVILKPVMVFFLVNAVREKRGQGAIGVPTFGDWRGAVAGAGANVPANSQQQTGVAGQYGSYQEH